MLAQSLASSYTESLAHRSVASAPELAWTGLASLLDGELAFLAASNSELKEQIAQLEEEVNLAAATGGAASGSPGDTTTAEGCGAAVGEQAQQQQQQQQQQQAQELIRLSGLLAAAVAEYAACRQTGHGQQTASDVVEGQGARFSVGVAQGPKEGRGCGGAEGRGASGSSGGAGTADGQGRSAHNGSAGMADVGAGLTSDQRSRAALASVVELSGQLRSALQQLAGTAIQDKS